MYAVALALLTVGADAPDPAKPVLPPASPKEALQPFVDTRSTERPLDQRVEAERRKMSLVEHDRVPKGNRLTVVRLV